MTSADSFIPPPDGALVVVAAARSAGRPVRRLIELASDGSLDADARIHVVDPLSTAADHDTARRIVAELDAKRVWVVIPAASPERQLLRLWQADVLAGGVSPYAEWLEGRLEALPTELLPLDELLAVWSRSIGSDRLLLVVDDPASELYTGRRLEELIGLATGTLTAGDAGPDPGRDLAWSEIELLRAANKALADPAWDGGIDRLTLRSAVAEGLRSEPFPSAAPGTASLPTPVGALAVEHTGRQMVAVESQGVAVLGKLRRLVEVNAGTVPSAGEPGLGVPGAARAIQRAIEAGLELVAGQAARERRTP